MVEDASVLDSRKDSCKNNVFPSSDSLLFVLYGFCDLPGESMRTRNKWRYKLPYGVALNWKKEDVSVYMTAHFCFFGTPSNSKYMRGGRAVIKIGLASNWRGNWETMTLDLYHTVRPKINSRWVKSNFNQTHIHFVKSNVSKKFVMETLVLYVAALLLSSKFCWLGASTFEKLDSACF